MAADPSKDRLSEEIETDLRLLSAETRRSEGFTSWLTGPDFPQIKEAAERGVLKLRGVTGRSSESVDAVQKSKEVLKPFQLACHSKNTKLASIALVSFQKLLAKEAVSDEGIEIMISGLEQVEEMHDEGVQLKLLQTVLAMLQSSIHAHLEDCSKRILGIGFRLLGYSRNSDSVVSTASATVRQGVALVFDHISLTPEQMQREEGARPSLQGPESPRDGPEGFESGSAYAALKLLDDLCLMAGGSPSTWLRTASPPRTFVLELLDFVVVDNVAVFRSSPVFEHALLSRVCHLLLGQLHDLLDPTLEGQGGHGGHGHFALLRIVLKTTRTVLRQFYTLLGAKCGAFIEVLLSGTASNCALWQRVGAAQTLRQVCGEAGLVHHLFVTYDMRWEVKLAVVQKTMQTCSDVIFSATSAPSLDGQQEADPEATAAIAACHLAAAEGTGKQMVTGGEVAHMTPDEGTAYVAMLAIECIAAIVSSVETLTVAVTTFPLATADKGKELTEGEAGSANGAVDEATCKEMVDRLAAVLKQTLSRLIASASPGTLLNALFGCYQQFVEACGLLGVPELRDSFLKNLNTFTFTFPDAAAPVALPNDGAARLQQPSGGPPPAQQQRLFLSGTEHATLDAKNLVALRTLYAIATRLALQLGDSWMLVLGTVNCVDCILATPRQAAQEGSAHGHNAQLAPSDLAEVSAGASALFQRTADMSDEAVVTLLGALHAVSAASLSTAVLHGGHTKLFALERMVQVLHVNMHRIYDLWGIFLSHVLEVLASSKAGLRTAAMDAIGKAIIGALSRRAPAGCTEDADGGVENMLLVALTSLYTDEREADVQLGVLRVTINVLERHGERLTQGWVPLLRLLAAVPQRGGADAIKLGFRSLELLCSDYLSSLTVEQLRRCLEVAAMYANQQADLNVSLTAISQLWNAADFLARLPTLDSDSPTGTPGVVPPAAMMASSGPPSTGSLRAAGVDSSKYAELLEVLFGALQALSTDSRPEVRNSGVRTLFLVVVTHGGRLNPQQWQHVWWHMCFPLLCKVHHTSTTSSREEAQVEVLGKLRGESVKMLVHHSRNSEQKQWDETLVVALSGTGRLLRAHLRTLVAVLPNFDEGWEELMLVVESSLAGGRHETASAAMTLLTAVLTAHAKSEAISPKMWKRALHAVTIGVEAASHPECSIPIQARLELVAGIAMLLSALSEVFDEEDMRLLFRWLFGLVYNPWSEADSKSACADQLLPVQRAALSILEGITHLKHDQLWIDLLEGLSELLRPDRLTSGGEVRQSRVTAGTMAVAVRMMSAHYSGPLPVRLRAAILPGLLQRVAACMAWRHTTPGEPLWRAAAAGFQEIVTAGVPAVNIASMTDDAPSEVWSQLATILQTFFFGNSRNDSTIGIESGGGSPGIQVPLPPPSDKTVLSSVQSVTLNYDADGSSGMVGHSSSPRSSAEGELSARLTLVNSPGDSITGDATEAADAQDGSAARSAADSRTVPLQTTSASQQQRVAVAETGEAAAVYDVIQAQADATLECSVLDVLTDGVLAACPFTPSDDIDQYIHIIARGVTRVSGPNEDPEVASAFPCACLKKLAELAMRGNDDSQSAQPFLLHIAQVAYPILLVSCRAILKDFATGQGCSENAAPAQHPSPHDSRGADLQLQMAMAVVQVCRELHLSPLVATVKGESPMASQLLQVLRGQSPSGQRVRSQLFYLYEALVACIPARDPAMREAIRAALSLAGTEMGLAPSAA